MNGNDESTRAWTVIGLAIALFGSIVVPIAALLGPRTVQSMLLRESTIFALAGALAFIIRRKERLGWDSVGLQRPALGNTALWTLIAILGSLAAIAVSFGAINLFGLRFGSSDSATWDALPKWVVCITIVRAGFVEEFFYRGYAIERLHALTGNRVLAAGVPLLVFAGFHYRQGAGGMLVALLTGGVLTAVYLYKRNLWANIAAHFLVDFVPNVLIPLFVKD